MHLQIVTRQPAVLASSVELAAGNWVLLLLYCGLKLSLGEMFAPSCAEKSSESVPPHAMTQAVRIGR